MSAQFGLLTPFRRDKKSDFASGSGPDLLKSKVIQVLATEGETASSSGELPWRTAFGAAFPLLRHQNNDVALAGLAQVYARNALRQWVPEAELLEVSASRVEDALVLRIRFREASLGATGGMQAAAITL